MQSVWTVNDILGWQWSSDSEDYGLIIQSVFSLFPSKIRENWDQLSVYFSIFYLSVFIYSKKAIWHLAILQSWCFDQFHNSKIEKENLSLSERKYFTHGQQSNLKMIFSLMVHTVCDSINLLPEKKWMLH